MRGRSQSEKLLILISILFYCCQPTIEKRLGVSSATFHKKKNEFLHLFSEGLVFGLLFDWEADDVKSELYPSVNT